MALSSYLKQASAAWNDYDGNALAELLSLRDKHARNPKLLAEDPSRAVTSLEEMLDDLVLDHLLVIKQVSNHAFVEAYEHQVSLGRSLYYTKTRT